MSGKLRGLTIAELCRWVAKYAFRRRLPFASVIGTMLLKIGLDVLKPWPMLFLVDYVLGTKVMPQWLSQFVTALPGESTPTNMIGWTVASTVFLFLCSWALGLANAYANIALGQRMIYDLAADL